MPFLHGHSDDIKNILVESTRIVRKEQIYAQHVGVVAVNEDLKKLDGVNKPSRLMSLDYFSVHSCHLM